MTTAKVPEEGRACEAISRQLHAQGIRTHKDVETLYLSKQRLESVPDLSVFPNLTVIRLNSNNLRSTAFLRSCQLLTELYLQDNQIACISGTMDHLTCLKVISLQRNQLTKLERVTSEFRFMQDLQRLNLSENPIAQEVDYRHFVVFHCPSVVTLDREEVTNLQRRNARKAYDQDQELVRDRVAFGRRSEGPPEVCYPAIPPVATPAGGAPQVGDSFLRDNPPFPSTDAAYEARRSKKSLVEYTRFDWSKIPRFEQRRVRPQAEVQPELVTVRLKI